MKITFEDGSEFEFPELWIECTRNVNSSPLKRAMRLTQRSELKRRRRSQELENAFVQIQGGLSTHSIAQTLKPTVLGADGLLWV